MTAGVSFRGGRCSSVSRSDTKSRHCRSRPRLVGPSPRCLHVRSAHRRIEGKPSPTFLELRQRRTPTRGWVRRLLGSWMPRISPSRLGKMMAIAATGASEMSRCWSRRAHQGMRVCGQGFHCGYCDGEGRAAYSVPRRRPRWRRPRQMLHVVADQCPFASTKAETTK